MRTIGLILTLGLSILLLVTMSFTKKIHNDIHSISTTENAVEMKLSLTSLVNMDVEDSVYEIEDISVIELEEEVTLEFDTNAYLPSDFNPYEGMNTYEELLFEEKIALSKIIDFSVEQKELKIEDIKIIELEEELDDDLLLESIKKPSLGMTIGDQKNIDAISIAYKQLETLKFSEI